MLLIPFSEKMDCYNGFIDVLGPIGLPFARIMDHLYLEDMELTNEGFEKKEFARLPQGLPLIKSGKH